MNSERNEIEYYKSLGINTNAPRFIKFKKAGLLDEVDELFVEEAKQYWWEHYHKKLDPVLHIAFMNLTGNKDPRIAHPRTVGREFVSFFNDQRMTRTYRDKNLYDKLIPSDRAVETVLKRAHGLYFDKRDNYLEKAKAISEVLSFEENLIVKPSDTNNGMGIKKLYYSENSLFLDDEKVTLDILEERYGANFAVQKVLQQHPIMSNPHPASANTLRMVTLRWKGEIKYLLTFARFGSNNGVQDNAGAGGLCIGVTSTGEFLDTAIDEDCMVYTEHPTTGFLFKEMDSIPNFDKFKQYAKDLHKEVLHHDFISWDIAIGADGLPVFLEANFSGATWIYQLAAQQPLFGDFTEEILEHVFRERNDKKSPRWKRLNTTRNKNSNSLKNSKQRVKNLMREKENLKEKNNKLQEKLNETELMDRKMEQLQDKQIELVKERDQFKRKYNDIKDSRSWRMTVPARKFSSLFKRK